jgi:hypothetical protein
MTSLKQIQEWSTGIIGIYNHINTDLIPRTSANPTLQPMQNRISHFPDFWHIWQNLCITDRPKGKITQIQMLQTRVHPYFEWGSNIRPQGYSLISVNYVKKKSFLFFILSVSASIKTDAGRRKNSVTAPRCSLRYWILDFQFINTNISRFLCNCVNLLRSKMRIF